MEDIFAKIEGFFKMIYDFIAKIMAVVEDATTDTETETEE